MTLIKRWMQEGFDVGEYAEDLIFKLRDEGPQPACDLTFVTSLSPNRIRRQKTCLRTWRNLGVQIKAIQAPHEIEAMRSLYEGVQFIATTDVLDGKVRFRRLAAEARTTPVIVLNSDLEVYGSQADFVEAWSQPGVCLGYRWNYKDITESVQEYWGIDAIKIEPAMVEHLRQDELCALGAPGWDWLVPTLLVSKGFRHVAINQPQFFHQIHSRAWTDEESARTQSELSTRYGITISRMRHIARLNREGGEARVVV
ncbi:MAG: hypothetical protein Fues2KO_47370 [Fuerstiella sp.]